jgi:carboxymethylenebutenolidase
MENRTHEVETADGPMPLYESLPDGEPRGGVVVIQEAFGVNDHIEDVTRRFAGAGYQAVAPHLFHRTGSPVVDYGDLDKVLPNFQALSDDKVLLDVDAALDHLRAQGFVDGRIGLVGFCFGGRVSFLVAARRAIGAAVGFYGGGIVSARFPMFPPLIDEVPTLKTPWLGLFGDDDRAIPVTDVETLRATLDEKSPVDHEIVRYAGAGHGFHCDMRPDYHPEAAKDGWRRTLDWFEGHLG